MTFQMPKDSISCASIGLEKNFLRVSGLSKNRSRPGERERTKAWPNNELKATRYTARLSSEVSWI